MRKYHRWLSVLFGIFILWIAVTGVLSQIGSLVNNGGFERESAERGKRPTAAIGEAVVPTARAQEPGEDEDETKPATLAAVSGARSPGAAPAAFVCPPTMNCRPKQAPGAWNVGFLHHLHSGEQFGPVGTIISLLSGLGLIFFAISGMWMYFQMFTARGRNRGARGEKNKLFW